MSEIFAPGSVAGLEGPSAYQVAVSNGFAGSQVAWLASLAGIQGVPGAAGSSSAITALANSMFPLASGNLFDYTKATASGIGIQTNGTTFVSGNVQSSGFIYCPGAISAVCNETISLNWSNLALYDANGECMAIVAGTSIPSLLDGNGCIRPYSAFPLPGTQTYLRFSWVPSWTGGTDTQIVLCAAATGTATLVGDTTPNAIVSLSAVNTKIAALTQSTSTALAATARSVGTAIGLFAQTTLPTPPAAGNLFDPARSTMNTLLHPDGTLTAVGGVAVATIFCAGATSFITNMPVRGQANGWGFGLYDTNGSWMADISATLPYAGSFVAPNTVIALPGTQGYIKICYSVSDLNLVPWNTLFFAGSPCISSLPILAPPFGGTIPSTTVKTASQLGCLHAGNGTDYNGVPFDNAPLLNAFLATASPVNPVKLILDGSVYVSGLVISPSGYTTIEGLGHGTGIVMPPDNAHDGIRIGPLLSGNSEGDASGIAPARTASNIVLRDFTLDTSNGVNGAIPTYGAILTSCTDVVVDNVHFIAGANYCLCVSNMGSLRVSNSTFTTGGTLHDGVHVDGPCEDIGIVNCDFATGDDAIALNAPEGYGGDITRVTVTNCRFHNSLTVARAYTSIIYGGSTRGPFKIRDVVFANCTGTTSGYCFNLGISDGAVATLQADQIQDFSVVNCTLSSPLGLATLLTPIGSISFRGVKFIPLSATPVISVMFPSVGMLEMDGVQILRNPDGNAAPASLLYIYSGASLDRVSLKNFAVVDEEGSSYATLPCLLDLAGPVTTLRLGDFIDLSHVAALTSAAGWGRVSALAGGGLLGTGTPLPDSVMANNALYLSSNAGGAVSIKVGGTAKRLTLA